MFSVCQTCPDVLRLTFRGFCTVFGFSLFGRVGVNPGISQWYRVGDAGALRAEPLATLLSCAVKNVSRIRATHTVGIDPAIPFTRPAERRREHGACGGPRAERCLQWYVCIEREQHNSCLCLRFFVLLGSGVVFLCEQQPGSEPLSTVDMLRYVRLI